MLALALIGSLSHAQDAHDVVIGVDLPTVDRMSTDEQDKMLAALHAAGVHVIGAWITDDASYEFVRKAFAMGIKADLTAPFQYRADAQKRRKVDDPPSMHPKYPLSAVDPEKTRAVFEARINKLEAMGIDFR